MQNGSRWGSNSMCVVLDHWSVSDIRISRSSYDCTGGAHECHLPHPVEVVQIVYCIIRSLYP